jgi:hypothetical protein
MLGDMRTAAIRSEADFLRTLLFYGDSEQRQRLLKKVSQATREERWSWRGMWLMAALAASYFYALAYAPLAELGTLIGDPEVVLDIAGMLGLGLLFSVAVFMGHWLWQRGFLHRVEDESRRFVLGLLESGSRPREPRPPMFHGQALGSVHRVALALR